MFALGGWRKGRGGCVRHIGHKHDFCQARKAENTDPGKNYAVKYATARGIMDAPFADTLLVFARSCRKFGGKFAGVLPDTQDP